MLIYTLPSLYNVSERGGVMYKTIITIKDDVSEETLNKLHAIAAKAFATGREWLRMQAQTPVYLSSRVTTKTATVVCSWVLCCLTEQKALKNSFLLGIGLMKPSRVKAAM